MTAHTPEHPAGTDRLLTGDGVSDAHWRASTELSAATLVHPDAVFGDSARVVVVSPQPANEILGLGGLIAAARAMGRQVLVVVASDGEACRPGDARWTPAELGIARRRELRDALDRLGPGIGVRHLALPDGGLRDSVDAMHHRLDECLRRDDVVLVPWRGDGRPDDEAAGHAGRNAAQDMGCPSFEYPVWGWHWAAPDTGAMPWAQALRVEIDASAQARKHAAIDALASQLATGAFDVAAPLLSPAMRQRFERPFEVVFA